MEKLIFQNVWSWQRLAFLRNKIRAGIGIKTQRIYCKYIRSLSVFSEKRRTLHAVTEKGATERYLFFQLVIL
jgi:hypothetical protein